MNQNSTATDWRIAMGLEADVTGFDQVAFKQILESDLGGLLRRHGALYRKRKSGNSEYDLVHSSLCGFLWDSRDRSLTTDEILVLRKVLKDYLADETKADRAREIAKLTGLELE